MRKLMKAFQTNRNMKASGLENRPHQTETNQNELSINMNISIHDRNNYITNKRTKSANLQWKDFIITTATEPKFRSLKIVSSKNLRRDCI